LRICMRKIKSCIKVSDKNYRRLNNEGKSRGVY
jgi:hypothetical protein